MSLGLPEEVEALTAENSLMGGIEEPGKASGTETADEATDPGGTRLERSDSPVPSVLSMMTDRSKSDPPNFSNKTEAIESRHQTGLTETYSEPQCRKRLRGRICDVCSGGRARAVKFCQTCRSFYCETHIREHYTAEELQIHKLQDITEDMDSHQEKLPVADAPSLHQDDQKKERTCKSTSILQKLSWKRALHLFITLALFMTLWFKEFTPKESGRSPAPHDLRIVLLGKTGAGKSATGNTILGRKVFKEGFSPISVTSKCETHSGEVAGRNVTVMDTPGILHTSLSSDQINCEMTESISYFLLVIRLGRFIDEDMAAPKWLLENFGEEALQYTMLLFTGGDELETPVEEFLRESSGLQELIHSCGGGYHVFNNKEKSNRTQVTELLEKIEAVLFKMTGYHHATKMIQQAQRKWEMGYLATIFDMKTMLIIAIIISLALFTILLYQDYKIQNIKVEDRKEFERDIGTEEERKSEEMEKEISIDQERKSEETEREISIYQERKSEETEREISIDQERKSEEMEREISIDQERKSEETERAISD